GGRPFHGVGQPGEEWELRGLANRAGEEEEGDGEIGAGAHGVGGLAEDLAVVEGAEGGPDEHDAEGEAAVAHPGDDEGLLARVSGGLLLVPEADQEIRAEAHRLPAHVEEEEVASHYERQHGEDEEVEVGEEAREARIV